MTWTPKQIDAAHVARGPHRSPGAPAISDAEVVAIMDSARNALAANGGAMTAGTLVSVLGLLAESAPQTADDLRQHIAAQGAKVAALKDDRRHTTADALRERLRVCQAERTALEVLTWDLVRVGVLMFEGAEERADANARAVARLKPSGHAAEDVSRAALMVGSREKASQARADLDCLAALAQHGQEAEGKAIEHHEWFRTEKVRADAAESQLRAIRERATKASAELRHAYRPETRDWNLVARAIRILEEVTTPNAPHRPCSPFCAAHELSKAQASAVSPETMAAVRKTLGMSEDSSALQEAALDGWEEARERGAEDMRAACWEAVQEVLAKNGWTRHSGQLREDFKAAIDGAVP